MAERTEYFWGVLMPQHNALVYIAHEAMTKATNSGLELLPYPRY